MQPKKDRPKLGEPHVMDPAGQLFPPHRIIVEYMQRESGPGLDSIQQTGWVSCSLLSILAKIPTLSKNVCCAGPAGPLRVSYGHG